MPALASAYANASRLVATAPTNALLSLTLAAPRSNSAKRPREHADADARAAYEQAHAAVKPWFQHDTMSRDFRVIGDDERRQRRPSPPRVGTPTSSD